MSLSEFKESIKRSERTEEVQYIIERMPTKFGFVVSILTLSLFLMLIIFGFAVKYPDVVTGNITINAEVPPVKLIAFNSGKIKLIAKSQQPVKSGDLLAYIDNSANINDIKALQTALKKFTITQPDENLLHTNWVLGELTSKYYPFMSAIQNYKLFYSQNLFSKQIEDLQVSSIQETESLKQLEQQYDLLKNNVQLTLKSFKRDSILFKGKVESESEFEKSKMNFYSIKRSYHDALNAVVLQKERISENSNKIQQIIIQKGEKEQEVKMSLASTYNDLVENLSSWQQRYEFVSPINGKVQFLNFWRENQFILQGGEIFSIISQDDKPFGELVLPSSGAGKVKVGQEVMIKLENYPYQEFGTIKGRVNDISLTTNQSKDKNNANVNSYLITVGLPDNLKTNYGSYLDFKSELRGTADIITADRKFAGRLFDNLKYFTR
jgi:multidrug resistance efflux pump